ncbi:MAG: hypothetical protein ACK5XN_34985 [Bacteroidota bacterium]
MSLTVKSQQMVIECGNQKTIVDSVLVINKSFFTADDMLISFNEIPNINNIQITRLAKVGDIQLRKEKLNKQGYFILSSWFIRKRMEDVTQILISVYYEKNKVKVFKIIPLL